MDGGGVGLPSRYSFWISNTFSATGILRQDLSHDCAKKPYAPLIKIVSGVKQKNWLPESMGAAPANSNAPTGTPGLWISERCTGPGHKRHSGLIRAGPLHKPSNTPGIALG